MLVGINRIDRKKSIGLKVQIQDKVRFIHHNIAEVSKVKATQNL